MCENCSVDTLVILNVTNEQVDDLAKQLVKNEFYFTRVASSGGFLNYPNTSLLIGIAYNRLDDLKKLIFQCCRRRIAHIATQSHAESYPHHSQPVIIEAEIGGASYQILAVEHFEQF
ncbi:MAG TPA: hypothetical protein DEH25_00420 [Chloroflexi bacterium]|nr:hypothetical protein [Chloroflexota bacterium]HBY07157.1 hypothetical protein [Chloroflexota bacterium]